MAIDLRHLRGNSWAAVGLYCWHQSDGALYPSGSTPRTGFRLVASNSTFENSRSLFKRGGNFLARISVPIESSIYVYNSFSGFRLLHRKDGL